MDEPLSNLDAKLRVQMRSEIIKLHEALGATTIYVTHDQTEAMTMATRIVVMKLGYIQQIGNPIEIYNKLLKVLGDTEELRIDQIREPVDIEPGDAFLLCTDGFWEYVYETEMEIDLIKSRSPKEWTEYMVKRLLLRPAAERDNFTVLAGWF